MALNVATFYVIKSMHKIKFPVVLTKPTAFIVIIVSLSSYILTI